MMLSGRSRVIAIGALAGPALALFGFGIASVLVIGDFPSDPDYAYLLNGLNIAQLRAPVFIGHPGTPLQFVAGLIIWMVWLIRSPFHGLPLVDDVLLHPELFLHCISLVLILASSVALFLLGASIYRTTRNLGAALVAELSIFLSFAALTAGLIFVIPEGLLVALTLLLAAALVPATFAPAARPQGRLQAALVGVILGACVTTKTTAAPLLLLVFLFSEWKTRFVAMAAAVASAVVLTLPIADRYGDIIAYNWSFLANSSTGRSSAPALARIAEWWNATLLPAIYVPEIFAALATSAGLALFFATPPGRREHPRVARFFLVCGLVLLAQLAAVSTHPGTHYFMPVAALVCLVNGRMALLLLKGDGRRRLAGALVLLALLAPIFVSNGSATLRWLVNFGAQRRDNSAVLDAAKKSGCRLVYGYENQSVEYKLLFGDNFTSSYYLPQLFRLYPELVIYREPARAFEMAGGILNSAAADRWVAEQNCVYLISSPSERFAPGATGLSPDHLVLADRSQHGGGSLAVYRLVPAAAGGSIFVAPQP